MTKLRQEYEGDIYRNHVQIGAYVHYRVGGETGFICFNKGRLERVAWSLKVLFEDGDREWSLSDPEEYVMPKEFLM